MDIEKKIQSFQKLKEFALIKSSKEDAYIKLIESLSKTSEFLNSGKICISICSENSLTADGLHNLFTKNDSLRKFYEPRIVNLSTLNSTDYSSIPLLKLEANTQIGQLEAQYNLSDYRSILIGRDLSSHNDSKAVLISLPMYKKISGSHAEIQLISNSSDSSSFWQICDLNSTNGTYINGQKIKGCQQLQSADKITLAYPIASEKAPGFIFEEPVATLDKSTDSLILRESDLIFLVINPARKLSSCEQDLIEKISKVSVFGFVIVADLSLTDSQQNSYIQSNLSSIRSWIDFQFPQLTSILEIVSLPLASFYPNASSTQLTADLEQQFNEFAVPFIDLANNQGVELLRDQFNQQLKKIIQQLEQILNAQEEKIKNETQRVEQILGGYTIEYWLDYSSKIRRQVDDEKDELFREFRTHFFRERDDFVTDFIPNNLSQKVDKFVNSLNPVVNRVSNSVCIQLQSENCKDLHTAMIMFCQAELTSWGDGQWKMICQEIGINGLEGLRKKAYTQLNCLPEFQLTNVFENIPTHINFSEHFRITFSEVQADISYEESSGNAFGGIAKIAMMTASTAMSASSMSPYAIIQGASLASAIGGFIGGSLSRPQQQKLKLEQVCESLRRVTSNHYRNIARYLLNRISQEVATAIDTEDRQFRKMRGVVDEQMRCYFIELDKTLKNYRTYQAILYQDKAIFEEIKLLAR
jgi:FHA domain